MGSQQFCLKWNNHQSNLLVVFDQLLQNEAFVDVTLACEGLSLKAHKMVLSACSPYFQSLFLENPCKHPIVILNSMRYCDLKAIIDFMYKGEVNVSQEQLSALLKTAEMLKVKGLAEVTNQTTQTLMTQSVPPLDSCASPTLPEQVGQPPPSSTSQRSSVSPPPKRKKLRSSAVSSSASSPQTPSMSTAPISSQKAELLNATLDAKTVPPLVLPLVTDLSQDGHSDHDVQTDQNLEQNPDLLMDAPPEISEDHSSTSNLTSEKGFEKSAADQTSQDPHSHLLDLAFQNLPSTPSTSGIQTATDLSWSRPQLHLAAGFPTSATWLKRDMLATALSNVAQTFALGRKTLSKDYGEIPKLKLKRGPKTLLTEEEEKAVVDYIHSFTGRGTRPRRDEIIRFASSILRSKTVVGDDLPDMKTKVGIKWWKKFRARHPELRDMRGNIPKERPALNIE